MIYVCIFLNMLNWIFFFYIFLNIDLIKHKPSLLSFYFVHGVVGVKRNKYPKRLLFGINMLSLVG